MALALAASARADYGYTCTTFDDPAGVNPKSSYQYAAAINNSGEVVGTYQAANGAIRNYTSTPSAGFKDITFTGSAAFLDSNGNYPTVNGVSNVGTTVGTYYPAVNNIISTTPAGFLVNSSGSMTKLAFPGGTTANPIPTYANGINTSGIVVGSYTDPGGTSHGFVYSQYAQAYVRFDLPDQTNGSLTAISDFGSRGSNAAYVIGPYTDGKGVHQSYLGSFVDPSGPYALAGSFLNPLASIVDPKALAGTTVAQGLNNLGQVVGYYEGADQLDHGFLYDSFTDTYTTLDDPAAGGYLTEATGINDSGQIVGAYATGPNTTSASFVHGFSATFGPLAAVPEPSSLALVVAGLGSALGTARLRGKAAR